MSYRKITVDDRVYEYTIGRSHTNIKGIGVFKNTEIGHNIDLHCECCGELMKDLYPNGVYDDGGSGNTGLAVTPIDIARQIRLGPK